MAQAEVELQRLLRKRYNEVMKDNLELKPSLDPILILYEATVTNETSEDNCAAFLLLLTG
jgi:hypothetical protein